VATQKIISDPSVTPSPEYVFQMALAREVGLSRLLVAYIGSGIAFMLLPGTFLGVWNLISISNKQATASVAPAWLQAHGQAQVFGWIGSFVLGIGFYSIPKLLRGPGFALWRGWTCWALWTTGVALRWIGNVYEWHWRVLLPVSAALELCAFFLFFEAVVGHRTPARDQSFDSWVVVVVLGTIGLSATLLLNFGAALYLAFGSTSPAFPVELDQRFLMLTTWGFIVPFVWGFSARWMLILLGLPALRKGMLLTAAGMDGIGVALAVAGLFRIAVVLILGGSVLAVAGLRMFEPAKQPAKTRGVHRTFSYFVCAAYVWLIVAAGLGVWAAFARGETAGIWGASRHALTVGFMAAMVFGVGQRVLPAFSGMRHLYSPRLMFFSQALLIGGCTMRVGSEILAYQQYLLSAWSWLPFSAMIELIAVTIFAINMAVTFVQPAPPVAFAGK
jgi:uncharacterized protein involved in response to NO